MEIIVSFFQAKIPYKINCSHYMKTKVHLIMPVLSRLSTSTVGNNLAFRVFQLLLAQLYLELSYDRPPESVLCVEVFLKVAGFGIKVKTNISFNKHRKVLDNKEFTWALDFYFCLSCCFHLRHFSFNY